MTGKEKESHWEDIQRILSRIEGRGYKAYKELTGSYDFGDFVLLIDHVQSDPFAAPSRFRARVLKENGGFPADTYKNRSRTIALRDFLTREFSCLSKKVSGGRRGTGKSGLISIDTPGQEILEKTSMIVNEDYLEARFFVGLPARGRTILTKVAEKMLLEEIPRMVRSSLFYPQIDSRELYAHVETAEDADFIRERLSAQNFVSFVADGSVLPRASGIDSRPLKKGTVVPFQSPSSLKVSFNLPNRGLMSGMTIPSGITLIVGGGYHGKSTLLDAVKLGIYNHVPGDGREFVVTVNNAVMIRAEDGRKIEGVDISPFISNLPYGQDTKSFSSDNASGSTSQAANIIEALEMGAQALLIDEDTSATNFMIRDHRMQKLISKDMEPITPFIDKVRQLHKEHGVSTIAVIGGSGDYFDVADLVVSMNEYIPEECTARAKEIAEKYKTDRKKEGGETFGAFGNRTLLPESIDPRRGDRAVKISSRGLLSIVFGVQDIDLGAVEQLVHVSQTRALGDAIHYATKYMNKKRTLKEVIDLVMADFHDSGLDVLSSEKFGDYASFRTYELAAAINRLRSVKVIQKR